MKKSYILSATAILAIILCFSFASCDLNANSKAVSNKAALETSRGKHSYAVGTDWGKAIKQAINQAGADVDYSLILQGIKDQFDTTSNAVLMNDSEVTAALQDFMAEIQKARAAKDSVAREERKQKADAFLEKNKSEVGVVTTGSGLQYIILKEGEGKVVAKDGDTITVHYTGSFIDGNKFDSSLDRNQPLSIALGEGQLIPGWVEMLRLMKKGEKVKTWIPSHLGYGEVGNRAIPGNTLLIFEMELLDIKPAKK